MSQASGLEGELEMKCHGGHPAEMLSSEVDRQHNLKQLQHSRGFDLSPSRAAERLVAVSASTRRTK